MLAGASAAAVTGPALPAGLTDYLCIEPFVADAVAARALASAFELGLVDALAALPAGDAEVPPTVLPWARLAVVSGCDVPTLRWLLDLLAGAGVLDLRDQGASLSPGFRAALRFRPLLQARLEAGLALLPELASRFTQLLAQPTRYRRVAAVWRGAAAGAGPDAGAATPSPLSPAERRRVDAALRLDSALAEHEAALVWSLVDVRRHRRLLDIGGGAGVLARQACVRHAGLQATVLDRPGRCEAGLALALAWPERTRLAFVAGDPWHDAPPGGHDLIALRHWLADGPAEAAAACLVRAAQALQPGGRLVVFERGPLPLRTAVPGLAQLPLLLRGPQGLRSPRITARALAEAGLVDVRCRHLQLGTPHHLVTARKPS